MVTTVLSWNIARRHQPWRQLVEMAADVALLQEARIVPPDVADRVDTGPVEHWDSHVCGTPTGTRAGSEPCSPGGPWW